MTLALTVCWIGKEERKDKIREGGKERGRQGGRERRKDISVSLVRLSTHIIIF